MKKLFLLLPLTIILSFSVNKNGLTDKERGFAANHLTESLKGLTESVKGLSQAQLDFKAAPDRWSIKECVYHLALSENNIWQWMQGTLQAPANPEKRSEIKMADEQVLAGLSDRTNKVKTTEQFEPKNAKWTSADEALNTLKEERSKHVEYMKTTNDDMRNHVAPQTPLGPLDAYQLVLLMSSHTIRHTKQIDEVKADPNFPKN